MKDFLSEIGGRKFTFGMLLTLGLFTLALFGKISYQELINAVTWVFGLFISGNVLQKFAPTTSAEVIASKETGDITQ